MQPPAGALAGGPVRVVVVACALTGAGGPTIAQDGTGPGVGQFGPAVLPLGRAAVGQPISRVVVEISESSGDKALDEAASLAVQAAAVQLQGRAYRPAIVDSVVRFLVAEGTVRRVDHRTTYDGAQGALALVVTVDLSRVQSAPGEFAPQEAPPSLPVIYQDERSKLTFIVSAGVGVYNDNDPWFGAGERFNEFSPIAGRLPDGAPTWGEAFVEAGLGGATRLWDSHFYGFAAVSGVVSASRGQDVFTDDARTRLHPDKGYAGVLYANPRSGSSAQLSVGRQTWTLNNGFLISMIAGSSNAGERGATYLGPRNTTDFSAVFYSEFGRSRVSLFYLDPDELEELESNTTFAGANFGWRFTAALSADASLITIPQSDSTYRTPGGGSLERQGTSTWGLHALWRPQTPDHLWLEGEAYRQSNSDFDMSAYAGYGSIGYIRNSLSWSPSISYRFASFSGDDPETDTFERFDSMMSTGLGVWLQGLSFGKVYRNANLNTHRVQANVSPRQGMNLTLTWHNLRADEINNLGANPALSQLSSRELGNEVTLSLRWGIDRHKYLQVVGSRALPGRALRDIGADAPWSTLQASLYVSF